MLHGCSVAVLYTLKEHYVYGVCVGKVQGRKFVLSSRIYNLPHGGTKELPCYVLTQTECLYIATKFNDEARAKLVLRWQELHVSCTRFPDTLLHILLNYVYFFIVNAKFSKNLRIFAD